MRFRKRMSIAKGMRVNFSKSGVSTTVGIPGLSTNIGKNGVYLNTGIPGTGLYNRHNLTGSAQSGSNTVKNLPSQVNVRLEDDGSVIIMDSNNNPIRDEGLLRKIRSTDDFKQLKAQLMNQMKEDIERESLELIEIHKLSSQITPMENYQYALNNLKAEEYQNVPFAEREPTENDIRTILANEAKTEVKTLAIWKAKKLQEEWIEKELPERYSAALNAWQEKKANHEKEQAETAEAANRNYQKEYELNKEQLEKAISGDIGFIEEKIEIWLSSIELPVNFSVQYEIEQENKKIKIDLDLPNIEDIPKDKVAQLATGQVKRKPKTQKELKHDYMCCVFGLSVFVSSYIFEISPVVGEIVASGYTQRRNKKTGDNEEEYIYSVKFTRSAFENVDFQKIDIADFWNSFENRCLLTQTYDFDAITPY